MTDTTKPLPPPQSKNNLSKNNPSRKRTGLDYSKIFESKIFWTVLVILLFSIPLGLSFFRPKVSQQPILGNIGEFNLVNQEGRKFSNRDVAGSVLLVNFVFTRCPDVCSTLTHTMAQVQERLKGTAKSIQLITVSVDPDFDKPLVLKEYAQKNNADLSTWSFLTGSRDAIRKFVVGNFAIPMGVEESKDKEDMGAGFQIAHGENFVMVDQLGRIRGYEQIRSSEDINKILRKMAILVNTPPS